MAATLPDQENGDRGHSGFCLVFTPEQTLLVSFPGPQGPFYQLLQRLLLIAHSCNLLKGLLWVPATALPIGSSLRKGQNR